MSYFQEKTMTEADLKSRMNALSQKLEQAEARLKHKGLFAAYHQASAVELRDRYTALSQKLRAEIAGAEAHGHQVSALEASIRQWLDSLEIEMD